MRKSAIITIRSPRLLNKLNVSTGHPDDCLCDVSGATNKDITQTAWSKGFVWRHRGVSSEAKVCEKSELNKTPLWRLANHPFPMPPPSGCSKTKKLTYLANQKHARPPIHTHGAPSGRAAALGRSNHVASTYIYSPRTALKNAEMKVILGRFKSHSESPR